MSFYRLVLGAAVGLGLVSAVQAQDRLIPLRRLPVALAQGGVDAAMTACEARGHRVSAAVVDADGGLHTVSRGDGAGIQTIQSATDKAITSAVFKQDSSAWVDRAARGEPISPLLNQLPHLLLAKGGVVIRAGEEVIGAIAVAGAPGGEIDEACARVGLDAIRNRLAATEADPAS